MSEAAEARRFAKQAAPRATREAVTYEAAVRDLVFTETYASTASGTTRLASLPTTLDEAVATEVAVTTSRDPSPRRVLTRRRR